MATDSKRSRWTVTTGRPRLGIVALMSTAILSYSFLNADVNQVSAAAPKAPARLVAGADGVPTTAAAEYAWFLFATTVKPSPGKANPLAFENWTEQCSFSPPMPGICSAPSATAGAAKSTARKAHGSPLRHSFVLKKAVAGNRDDNVVGCTPLPMGPSYPNVTVPQLTGQLFCEEVFANPDEASFINTHGMTTLAGQADFAKGKNISMPWTSLEIKVDWVSTSSATCTSPTIYMEMIQFEGQKAPACFAMTGMHISSKVLPDWLWATFEPANTLTNPNRCNPNLYGNCFDPWGTNSAVPYGPTNPAAQSPAAAALIKAAGLPAVFNNYFLTGVQTQFVDKGVATQLGNSFVEYWAGVLPAQASCITCHSYAIMNPATNPPTEIGQGVPTGPQIGPGATVAAGQVQQDFSWMLAFMQPAAATAKKK